MAAKVLMSSFAIGACYLVGSKLMSNTSESSGMYLFYCNFNNKLNLIFSMQYQYSDGGNEGAAAAGKLADEGDKTTDSTNGQAVGMSLFDLKLIKTVD